MVKQKQIITIGVVIVTVGIILAIGYQKRNLTNQVETLIVTEPVTEKVGEVRSLDGIATLILERTINKNDQTQIYSFKTADASSPIFTKTVSLSTSMALPANSWSPGNKYVFIEEKNEQGERNYLVLKASGEPVAKDQPYYNVGALFTAKKIKYILSEATGWASPTLLILTTKKDQENSGPSFWFEIPSKAFLQLSR